eukprot:Gb_16777 [translate_table: standard]
MAFETTKPDCMTNEDLDPYCIPQDVVSDEEMLAVWGPKHSYCEFNYRLKEEWVKEIEEMYAAAYGSEKVRKNTISEAFARCFLAHKKGHSVNWARFSDKIENSSVRRFGSRNSFLSKLKRPFKGYVPSSHNVDCKNQEARRSLRISEKLKLSNIEIDLKKSKEGRIYTPCNTYVEPYVQQIMSLIQALNSRIEVQKQLKAGYEENLENMKEIFKSYSSVSKSVAEAVSNCRSHIDELKAEIKRLGDIFIQNVEEICVHSQFGHDNYDLNGLLTKERATTDRIKRANLDLDAYQKQLQENVLLEQACKKKMDEQAGSLEKMENQIVRVAAAIAELKGTLRVQKRYKKHLEKNSSASEVNRAKYLISPLPVYHPFWAKTDPLTVINVSPCPVCHLYFGSESSDIIVASYPQPKSTEENASKLCTPKVLGVPSITISRTKKSLEESSGRGSFNHEDCKTMVFHITSGLSSRDGNSLGNKIKDGEIAKKQFCFITVSDLVPKVSPRGEEETFSPDLSSSDEEQTLADMAAKLRRIRTILSNH